ncbi:protein of unknown function [Tepidibacter aestuarii]|nr:protein of unknown function [Tepidibacter aestuarii]
MKISLRLIILGIFVLEGIKNCSYKKMFKYNKLYYIFVKIM